MYVPAPAELGRLSGGSTVRGPDFGGAAMSRLAVVLAAALLLGIPAMAQDKPDRTTRAVSFSKEVLPVLKASCGKCHSGGGAKGGVDLSTYAAMKKGGKSGPVFVEGDPDKSPLVT